MPREPIHIEPETLFARYEQLQRYVGWEAGDADRIHGAASFILPNLERLIDDFYDEILRHEETRARITGGDAQVERLKGTLGDWLRGLFSGKYDKDYVARRWLVGWRHVEIGLRQVFVNAALTRLRCGILKAYHENFHGDDRERFPTETAINRILDLDLAIIQDAYEAEKHLRSEAAFRSLVEAADCAIFILRTDYTIDYLNPFAQTMTGYDLQAAQGNDFLQLLVPTERRKSIARDFAEAVRGQPSNGRKVTVVGRNRQRRQLVWNVKPLEVFSGSPALLAVGHDITELDQAQARALQSERLAAIGQTMTGLAHESRNAFQRIQACLEMLEMEISDQGEAIELVQRIQRALDQLHQLNEEVRSYAAPIRLETQGCDLCSLWREAWQNLEISRREKRVELCEASDAALTECEVDRFAMEQVFRNVLENALAACPDEGVIEVDVAGAALEDGRPAVTVRIRDNGSGFPDGVRDQIFEPFFTTKTKGTGLGMAIVKRIVEAHGGSITAHAPCKGGAEILITLPRTQH